MIVEKEMRKISEDIEQAMKNLNKNMREPTKMDKIVQIDPVYGEAVQENDESEEHVGKVFAEKGKEAEGITPETPSTGKKVKTAYTEQMKLDESLFEDYGSTVEDIRQFLKETVDWLISSEEGCGTLRLNYRLAVCVGWEDGYDPEEESVIHSTTNPKYGIVAGIKVWTSDDMLTDYEWINAPYYENGDVVDISASISPDEDYNQLARFFTEEYEKMKDWDIDEDGLILSEEPEEVEVEEKLDEMTNTELERAKKEFRDEQRELGVGWFGPDRMKYVPLPDDMKKREREFACIEMINSILAYLPRRDTATAEEILEDDLGSSPSYLKDDVDVLGKERVVELIQGQMDDIEGVDTDVYTDGEGVSYNSIRWKREACGKTGKRKLREDKVEGLPNNLYQLVYDRLFPDSVKNYKALILSENPKYYTSDRFYSMGLPSFYDIGVSVEDEEDADLVKQLADFLKLEYEYKPYKGKDGFKGIAIIHMDEKTGETPTEEYLDKIGYKGEIRRDPNAYKKIKVNTKERIEDESVESSDNKATLDEGVKIVTTSTLDDYEPWSGAKPWWDIIVKQDKVDELDDFLEEMYPEGIDETELNDLIWFEPEYVFEAIGINYDFQHDRLITDDEEEVEVEED